MSGTIAQLGVAVDSSDAVQAATDLERLVQVGTKAEKVADSMSAGFDKAATATAGLAAAEGKLSESTDDAMKRLTAMAKASLDSSEYYQSLTTSVNTNATALDNSSSSASSLAALQRRLQAESDALVGSTDRQAEAAKKSAAATGVQAEGLQALLGKINPAIAALDKLDQQQAQLQKYKAAGLIDADTFRDYSARIDASRQKLGDFDDGLKKTGVSSAQTQAALRQLPAQFSDIFTSLAGGQNPLMVLIQQGGQIKDSFGGVGNTFDVLKEKFRSLFTGGAGAAVLGESLAGIATNAKNVAENTGEAGKGLSDLAEGSNTAAEAAKNAQEAVGAIRPAISGVTIGAAGMALAVVAAAAALGALAYGYSQGSKETKEYNNALILTGNYAGTSAGRLADLAQQVSATNGTTGEAAASLAKLAASGAIAGESFKDIADAAAAMEDATGKSVDATIAEFVKIAKDPVAAAKELNDQYHFLTASTYSQIVALKEQGDTIGAAKLLTDTYADTVKGRAGEITQNLGTIEKAWKNITDEAKKSLDAIKSIGRDEGTAKRIADLTQSAAFARSALKADPDDTDAKKKLAASEKELYVLQLTVFTGEQRTKNEEDQARIQKQAIDDGIKLKAINDSNLTAEEKRNKLIREYQQYVAGVREANPNDPSVQPDSVARGIQNIKDKNKDPKAASSAGAVDLTAFNTAQNALKEIQADYSNTQKQLDAAQKAGLISQQEYLLKREALIGNERDEVTAAYETEIAALEAAKGEATTTAEQRIQLDQKIADARADMVKAQKAADSELEVLATNEQGRLKKQELAVQTYTSALQQQVDTLRQQGQRAAAGLGQGDRQRGLTDQQNAIDDRINSQKLDLANQYGDGSRGMSLDEYTQKLAALKTTQQDLHDTVQSNYDEMTDAQGNWSAGASSAWQNYLESARDVAGQTKSLFTNAFSSMEDAIVNFAMTGKLSFADFTKSILADMARIATRQASSALLSSLVGAATSYFTGGGDTNGFASGTAGASSSAAGASQAGYTNVDFSGYRAAGGPVAPNSLYEVNELGPELYNEGGKSFLMTGANGGSVTPLTSGAGPGVAAISNNGGGSSISINAPVSVITQDRSSEGMQIDQQALQQNLQTQMKAAAERAVADSWRAGGVSFRNVNGRA
jgi:lambda family phage tail tape measure protein